MSRPSSRRSRRASVLRTLAVVAVLPIGGLLASACGSSSSGYPQAIQSAFLSSCDASDGGGATQAQVCTCFLNWLEGHKSLTAFQADTQSSTTFGADILAAETSCPGLQYNPNGGTGSGGVSGIGGVSGLGGVTGLGGITGVTGVGSTGSLGSTTTTF